jgi:peptidyl-prolyl cis-trans isomerase C
MDKEETLKKSGLVMVLMAAVALMLAGCSESGKGGIGKGDDSDIVATVGDKVIHGKQIEQFLENLPPQVSSRYAPERIRKEIGEGLVSIEMLAWEARRRGIDKRDDVKLKIDMLTDQALAREIEEELKKGITVDDAELKKYYEEHKDRYGSRTRVQARQITVATEAEARAVLDRARKGEDFEALAKKHSKDEYASRGGSIGVVRPGKLPPDMEKVVLGLKEGQVSQVMKAEKGFVIVKADKVTTSKEKPFEQVKKSIERVVMREKLNKAVAELKEEIRKKAKVEIKQEYFAKFDKTKKDAPPMDLQEGPPLGGEDNGGE